MKRKIIAHYVDELFKEVKKHTVCHSLTEYSAAIFIKSFIEKEAVYIEFPFRSQKILGHTLQDELGITTMVNNNIEDDNRKFFTQAHELGHVLLHKQILYKNKEIYSTTQLPTISSSLNKVEQEANWFAAHLLLPDRVLMSHIYEGNCCYTIRGKTHVSKEAINYRLIDLLVNRFWIPKTPATKLADDFLNYSHNDSALSSPLASIIFNGHFLERPETYDSFKDLKTEKMIKENCDFADEAVEYLKKNNRDSKSTFLLNELLTD